MEIFDDPLRAAIYYTGMLLRQLCIVTTLAFVVFRLPALRRAVTDENPRWFHRLLLIILFSAVAVIDDGMGTVFDVDTGRPVERTVFFKPLERGQAILDLRDLVVTFGGLAGGVWIGLGAGLIAGINRYLLESHVGLAAAVATVVLELFGAILHHGSGRRPGTEASAHRRGQNRRRAAMDGRETRARRQGRSLGTTRCRRIRSRFRFMSKTARVRALDMPVQN